MSDEEEARYLAILRRKGPQPLVVAASSAAAPSPAASAIPQPLKVSLVPDEDEKKKQKELPDHLPATLQNADLEKNPPIDPYNSVHNDEYSPTWTFDDVKGQDAVRSMFERSLVKPKILTGLYDASSGGLGAILYGVAGK
jgi:hypothetical protein